MLLIPPTLLLWVYYMNIYRIHSRLSNQVRNLAFMVGSMFGKDILKSKCCAPLGYVNRLAVKIILIQIRGFEKEEQNKYCMKKNPLSHSAWGLVGHK